MRASTSGDGSENPAIWPGFPMAFWESEVVDS